MFWREEMKYVSMATLGIFALVGVLAVLLTAETAMIVGIVLMVSMQFIVHIYWTYERMVEDDDFTHNPLIGAIVGNIIMAIVAVLGAIVFLGIMIAVSSITGLPVYPLAISTLIIGWVLYIITFVR